MNAFSSRFDDKYHLDITLFGGKSKNKREASIVRSVEKFFDEEGVLLFDLLEPEVSKLHDSLLKEKKEK